MSTRVPWTQRLVRWWVSVYTVGLVTEMRNRRCAEIASDLWEQREDAVAVGNSRPAIALAVLSRALAGVPADLWWRVEMKDLERWGRNADRELTSPDERGGIEPLAFVLRNLRLRAELASRHEILSRDTERPHGQQAAAEFFGVPSLPPVLEEWLDSDGRVFLEGFPPGRSTAEKDAYDDALRSASIRLETPCPRRRRNRHRFSPKTRQLLETRLSSLGLDLEGEPDDSFQTRGVRNGQ